MRENSYVFAGSVKHFSNFVPTKIGQKTKEKMVFPTDLEIGSSELGIWVKAKICLRNCRKMFFREQTLTRLDRASLVSELLVKFALE